MECKYHKIRTKKGCKFGYCTLFKKQVDLFNCKCENKDTPFRHDLSNKTQKRYNSTLKVKTPLCVAKNGVKKQIKKKTTKLKQLEEKRWSILTDKLDTCYVCPKPKDDINEIYEGARRITSIKNGFCIPLCREHHRMFHECYQFALVYKKECQKKYEETHSREEFIELIKRSYL